MSGQVETVEFFTAIGRAFEFGAACEDLLLCVGTVSSAPLSCLPLLLRHSMSARKMSSWRLLLVNDRRQLWLRKSIVLSSVTVRLLVRLPSFCRLARSLHSFPIGDAQELVVEIVDEVSTV